MEKRVLIEYNLSDEDIISSLANGESKIFIYLHKLTFPGVKKMVIKNYGNEEQAFDIFQDTMTLLYEKARTGNFTLSSSIFTYIMAVSRNMWLNKLRNSSNKLKDVYISEFPENIAADNDVASYLQTEKNIAQLKKGIEILGEPCKTLLSSFYIENLDLNTIATRMGYNTSNTAKSQKYKCLNKLRKIFFT